MSERRWYSGTLRFFTVTADKERVDGEDSTYLVRAPDRDEAFRRFLAIGRQQERSYTNWHGHEVRIRFVAIKTIDALDREDLDGAEVGCTPLDGDDPQFTFDTRVDPEASARGSWGSDRESRRAATAPAR